MSTIFTEEEHKARDQLAILSKRMATDFKFHKIKTFKDLVVRLGHKDISRWFEHELNKKVTLRDVNEYLDDLRIELTTRQWLKHNPPLIEYEQGIQERDRSIDQEDKEGTPSNNRLQGMEASSTVSLSEADMSSSGAEEEKKQEKDYGWKPTKDEEKLKLFLPWFQKKAAVELTTRITDPSYDYKGQYLVMAGGYGKTFVAADVISHLFESGWIAQHSTSPWPVIYVTKAAIVEQTKRVLEERFGLDAKKVLVIHYDALRSKFGKLFVDETCVIQNGSEIIKWKWRPYIHPVLIIWDEGHALKNQLTTQHKIGMSFGQLENVYQIFMSATPFTKVSEAKAFACSTRHIQSLTSVEPTILTEDNWSLYAEQVTNPDSQWDYCPDAVDRLTDQLDKYIVRVRGVKPQFKAINKIEIIDFLTGKGKTYYYEAVKRYKKQLAKAEALSIDFAQDKQVIKLVAMMQYRKAAESNPDRISYIAQHMFQNVEINDMCSVAALNFKISVTKLVRALIELGASRDEISLIWGGGKSKVTKKQVIKGNILKNQELIELYTELFGSLEAALEKLNIGEDVEEAVDNEEDMSKEWRLGPQTMAQRQREIDRFQSGKTKYCIYTFKAGGVGLSLHHTDDLTKEKVSRKESGYAIEADIAKIPTRPRKTWIAPTWSPVELVQGTVRVPRLTSLSDTEQFLVFFGGTIEEQVAHISGQALRCLSKIIRQRESWFDLIPGEKSEAEFFEKYKKYDEDTDEDVILESDGEEE